MQTPDFFGEQNFTSQRLFWVANVLFFVFILSVLGAILPSRPFDPAWQTILIGALVNVAIYPLLGLALLHLAADLHPDDEQPSRRRRRFSNLAVPASLGFLLLIVLQLSALWVQITVVEAQRLAPLRQSEQAVANIRRTLQQSRSTTEIFQNLKVFKA